MLVLSLNEYEIIVMAPHILKNLNLLKLGVMHLNYKTVCSWIARETDRGAVFMESQPYG